MKSEYTSLQDIYFHPIINSFMQKTIKKTKDFFSLYRIHEVKKIFFSGWIAAFTAFVIVWWYHGDIDLNWLSASVASIAEVPRMEADLIIQKNTINNISLVFGAKAEKVDHIQFSILSDPTRLRSLSSNNPDIIIISDTINWSYNININMHGRDITTGTIVAELIVDMEENTPLILSDTVFMSNGQKYALTNKSE